MDRLVVGLFSEIAPPQENNTIAWTLAGSGVALVVVGGVLAMSAAVPGGNYDAALARYNSAASRAEELDATRDGEAAAGAYYGLLVGGAVVAVIGVGIATFGVLELE